MATVAPECQNNAYQQEVVRQHNNAHNSITYDTQILNIEGISRKSNFLHSNVGVYWLDRKFRDEKINNLISNNNLMVLLRKLENDLRADDYFNELLITNITETVSPLLNRLALLLPEKLKLEPTYDNSIFYTLIKNNKKYFIEQYLDYEEDAEDIEVSLVISDDDKTSRSFGGSIADITRILRVEIAKESLNTILLQQSI